MKIKVTLHALCLGCGMLGMWDVLDVECLEYGMFEVCGVWDVGYLGCRVLGMWQVRDVGCLGYGMVRMWNLRDVGCLGYEMFAEMWDVYLQIA